MLPVRKPLHFTGVSHPLRLGRFLTVATTVLHALHYRCTSRAAPLGPHGDAPQAKFDTRTRWPRVCALEICCNAVVWQRWTCSFELMLSQAARAWRDCLSTTNLAEPSRGGSENPAALTHRPMLNLAIRWRGIRRKRGFLKVPWLHPAHVEHSALNR